MKRKYLEIKDMASDMVIYLENRKPIPPYPGYNLPDEATTKINSIKLELISAFHEMSLNGIEFNYRSVCEVVERIVK